MNRRVFLATAAALPLAATQASAARMTLQDVAGAACMLFGAAVRADQLFADARFAQAVTLECGSITPEVELKWDYVERTRGTFDFAAADRLADFANKWGKDFHGHTLLWHRSVPGWAQAALATDRDWTIVRRFLMAAMARYGTARTWDVVNEPLDPNGERDDGLRSSPYTTAFGPDYIRRAFDDARAAAPRATLFLNEFGLLYEVPEAQRKRDALLRLLERLRHGGVPIGGVGLQAHLELARSITFNERIVADLLDHVGALGLQVRISELDVIEANTALPVGERDRRAGEAVRQLLDVAISNRAVGSISCWGLSDRYSWLPAHGPAGLNRGLPLDSDLARTPMYDAILAAMQRRRSMLRARQAGRRP